MLLTSSAVLQMQKLKVLSAENSELTNVLPLAWGGSEYSHAYFAHCQKFLPGVHFYLPCPFAFIFSKSSTCF